ncbi:MAG: TraR/DksA family transcriptional regulator [Desulfovibrio sp.]
MVDFADQASMASQGHLADALRKRERERMPGRAESAHDCEDCGDEIPEARRKAVPGCTRCTECQNRYERSHA